ncbi:hypothetical protein DYL61_26030 [Pseudomonas nabeulensis]|uniref:Uncharacterized protein n=1 Tax=Pseudomonas nabeulensis TaxID=2293833 RepID=A0A4Z0AL35_9PSED|nr:hypothetical protein DYL61_26030 [Pseudomonas nabeulensis]
MIVPAFSSLGDVLDIYRQLLDQPQTRAWFASKGLETDTLTLHKDAVKGFVIRDGVRTAVTFSTTDGSGWWEASIKLRAIRNLLDPDDKGGPCVNSGAQRIPLHMVSHAYGLDAPGTGRVVQDGLAPAFVLALDAVKREIGELDERAYLATFLEEHVQGLADDHPTDWSRQPTELSAASAQGIGRQAPYDVRQLLEHKGLGSASTAGETRNVIQWLRISLPPAPQFGAQELRAVASLADAGGASSGNVAGFELYQPAHMGRTLSEVRRDLERHLCEEKGLEPTLAVQVAHVGLAQAAPEFLVRDVPDAVAVGTPAWVELRLGCAVAKAVAPGTSRAMNEQQVCALTTLAPISEDQRTLMQVYGLDALLDWAVLNGVVPARSQGQYTREHIQKASLAFTRQRTLATRAFNTTSTALPTRRAMAVRELLKVFSHLSISQLESTTLQLADADERRNLRASEPRTRTLIETYMSGDLVPGKWALTRESPSRAQPARTPFQFQDNPSVPASEREALDAFIRRLPPLDGLLEKAVATHHRKQQMAFVTKLKLMFARLPLADRQRIELGAVDLFTLRKTTGKQQVWESDENRAAVTGRQGTLMRILHDQSVTYYEVLNSGKIIRHDDPQVTTALDRVVRDQSHLGQYKLLGEKYIRRGHAVPLDFAAYARGSAPVAGVTSEDVIIERLGRPLAAGTLPEQQTLASFVPDSFQSDRVEFIACEIAENNFYESRDDMLKRAREQLPVEKSREADARDISLLLSLVPFVGAYQDFADGNIGKGLQSLALDAGGLLIGAGGQARSLIRAANRLARGSLRPTLGRYNPVVQPRTPRLAWSWVEPKARFSDAAFDLAKQTALFFNAVFNPVDGYPRLISAASKGLAKFPSVLGTAHGGVGKTLPHLIAVEEKMRCYFLVGTGLVDPTKPPVMQQQ